MKFAILLLQSKNFRFQINVDRGSINALVGRTCDEKKND